jgi:xylan 1,4-beta-xylosidase
MRTARAALLAVAAATLLAAASDATAQRRATYSNPVIPFDYPDPSVIRVGDDFYAVATAGGWAPLFTVLTSRDAVNWTAVGSVFLQPPEWADDDFWAPEIVEHKGRYFVYYTARKKDGPLCVAAASADRPEGPYVDHGPLVCQEIGSIDAAIAVDAAGALFLLWKEDGNSRKQPTPIFAQRLGDDGITLLGEKTELIRNDAAWEGGVVEGPYILRRGDYYYLFYSGSACCGRRCDYALGVARSKAILGPWEKSPANPVLAANASWWCPGHGTVVADRNGRDFLLYHAYRASPDAFAVGRLALLDRVEWTSKGWPRINSGRGPSVRTVAPFGRGNARPVTTVDDFERAPLDVGWRWPFHRKPSVAFDRGALVLAPGGSDSSDPLGAVVARPTAGGNYTARVRVDVAHRKPGATVGIAAFAWFEHAVGISVGDESVRVWKRRAGVATTVASAPVPRGASSLALRVHASRDGRYRFAFSRDGKRWTPLGGAVDGSFLEGVQIALTAGGGAGRFESFAASYP